MPRTEHETTIREGRRLARLHPPAPRLEDACLARLSRGPVHASGLRSEEWTCLLPEGHKGPHMAHVGDLVAFVWEW